MCEGDSGKSISLGDWPFRPWQTWKAVPVGPLRSALPHLAGIVDGPRPFAAGFAVRKQCLQSKIPI